ncbi:hypothetical protein [Isoptericola sp. NPDC057391]|uniref:hypothetical protein n=1 Tax=Isoptericola sp. NPDC057391 TaxID=3346117 RepID=UPI00363A45FC
MSRDESRDDGRDESRGEVRGGAPEGAPAAPDGPRDDAAFARLRAADPAAGVGAAGAGLRAKVDARLAGDDAATAAVGAGTGDEERLGDGPAGRRRRRGPWLAAASVAALAAVGAGGYALGGAAAPGSGATAGTAEAPIVLNDGGRAAGAAGGDEAAAGGGAVGAAEDSAGASASARASDGASTMPSWVTSGRATFHAQGLSTEGGTASAYAFDATDAATREGAARLATALGVEGKPRWEHGWSVGPQDGSGPHVWLSADGSATFSFSDPNHDPWRCEDAVARGDAGGDAGDDAEGAEPACDEPRTSTVGDREARRMLADAMRSLGVNPDGFEIEVGEKTDGDPSRWVTAYQVVDGSRTGAQWGATVDEEGIAWLDGFLATTVDLGEYPVISPTEAVERLGDPRFSGSAWPVAYADEEAMWAESAEDGTEPTAPPAPPAAGDPVDWPVSDVEITDARLGLAQQTQDDGSVALVPAYELSDAAGNAWSVVAVADDAMDFSAPR